MSKETKKFLNKQQLSDLKDKHPLGFGKINGFLAGGIKFLLNSEIDWITGINLNIDGGYSVENGNIKWITHSRNFYIS